MASVESITRDFNESVKKLADIYNLRLSNIKKSRILIRVKNVQIKSMLLSRLG